MITIVFRPLTDVPVEGTVLEKVMRAISFKNILFSEKN
jgi:hypothetical protein